MNKKYTQIKPIEPINLANAIITPDGTILQSNHRWDYKEHTDKNGFTYMIDGGIDFSIRLSSDVKATRIVITSDHNHTLIREWFSWGSYGRNGDEPLHWIKLKDMTTEHVKNVIDGGCSLRYDFVFKNELEWRNQVD